jgi:hypothetical protein
MSRLLSLAFAVRLGVDARTHSPARPGPSPRVGNASQGSEAAAADVPVKGQQVVSPSTQLVRR